MGQVGEKLERKLCRTNRRKIEPERKKNRRIKIKGVTVNWCICNVKNQIEKSCGKEAAALHLANQA